MDESMAIMLVSCAGPATGQPIATSAPATEIVPTDTEIASTNLPETTEWAILDIGRIRGFVAVWCSL